MSYRRSTLDLRASFVAIAIAGLAVPAFASAQTTSAPAPTGEAGQEDTTQSDAPLAGDVSQLPKAAASSSNNSGEITITGSRIKRDAFNSADPVQVISPELEIAKGATSTFEILNSSPLASGSTQITSAISSNFVTDGGTGSETINLRGLGAARTLTLLNGRRAGPAGTRGGVSSFDLNILPSSLVKSVEILKSGASPIYGSDAIAGVVNLYTKTETNGLELGANLSIPEDGGFETYNLNAAYGKSFDRGHFIVAADYYRRNELTRGDRYYLSCAEDYIKHPDGTRADIIDPRTGRPRCTGTLGPIIRSYDYAPQVDGTSNFPLSPATGRPLTSVDLQYGPAGYLSPLRNPATASQLGVPAGFFPAGYSAGTVGVYNVNPPQELQDSINPSVERKTLYADASYEIGGGIELYAEGIYNNRKNYTNSSRQIFFQQYTSNTILAQAFGDCAACAGDPINVGFTGDSLLQPVIVTDHFDSRTEVNYYRGVAGLRGDIGFLPSWSFDGYGQFSRSDGTYNSDIIYKDAIDVATYRTASCAGTLTAIRGAPCIDINYTDPRVLAGNFTPEERAFLFGTDTGHTRYDQYTGELNTTGNLFKLPYGTVKAAVGIQYRRDSINDVPGPVTQSGNSWGLTSAGITAGYAETKEAYGEINIPILRNLPFFQDLTLNGAGRVTNVHAERRSDGRSADSNGNWTYKIGGDWGVTNWLRFRGAYGTSYRSPALFELFLANQTGFLDQLGIDPCLNLGERQAAGEVSDRIVTNCQAAGVPLNYTGGGTSSALVTSGGGIGFLNPETSTAKTASIILTPRFNVGQGLSLSLAVDYFNITVNGQISQLGASNIIFGCYNSDTFPSDPLCSNFVRVNDPNSPDDNQITNVYDSYLNINKQVNKGFDVTARAVQETSALGTFSLLAEMTWQSVDRFVLFEGTTQNYNGEAGDPIWTGNFTGQWTKNKTTFTYGLNVVGGTSNYRRLIRTYGTECINSSTRGGLICPDVRLEPTFYHTASLSQEVNDQFRITLGVANLFNTRPPRGSTVGSSISYFGQAPVASQYDYVGRRFFLNLVAKM